MLEHINKHRSCHVVTIEDPIEFLFEDKKAFINQREIGIDVPTFDDALRYLVDEDSDDDGLLDGEELAHGSDPIITDSDNDGWTDGEEVNDYSSDPTLRDPFEYFGFTWHIWASEWIGDSEVGRFFYPP